MSLSSTIDSCMISDCRDSCVLVYAPKRCIKIINDFFLNVLHRILYADLYIIYFMKNSTKFGAKVKTFIENCFKKNTFERELRRENTKISFYYLHAFSKEF